MANVSFCACWTSRNVREFTSKGLRGPAVIADHLMKRIDLPLNIMLNGTNFDGLTLFGLFAMTLMLGVLCPGGPQSLVRPRVRWRLCARFRLRFS